MKVISTGSEYRIFSDDIQTQDQLPVGTYTIKFDPRSGYSLAKIEDITTVSGKVYGNHLDIVDRVVRAYDNKDGSMGVLLSGEKGVGKTITSAFIAEKMHSKNIPTIIVDNDYPGIVDFITSITQKVFFLFDEFEKNFPTKECYRNGDDVNTFQEDFLPLLDGITKREHLYVFIANNAEERHISPFILGRPGRVHYHVRYTNLSVDVVEEYFKDNLNSIPNESDLQKMAFYCYMNTMPFDCLRAICEEMNLGYDFNEVINILNIHTYIEGSNSAEMFKHIQVSIFSEEQETNSFPEPSYISLNQGKIQCATDYFYISHNNEENTEIATIFFDPKKVEYNRDGSIIIPGHSISGIKEYDSPRIVSCEELEFSFRDIIIPSVDNTFNTQVL